MVYIGDNLQSYDFNLITKVAGSIIECPIIVKQNNIELTQIQYDKLKLEDTTILNGNIEVYFDFHYIRDVLNKTTYEFIEEIINLTGITDAYNNTTSAYETFTIFNILDYVDSDCIMRTKYTDIGFIDVELVLSRIADIFAPISIKL